MKAVSTMTGQEYDSWSELVQAETNGHCIVVMMQRTSQRSGRAQSFARVIGPFPEKKQAMNKAASVRRTFKKRRDQHPGLTLLGVSVEAAWPDIDFTE